MDIQVYVLQIAHITVGVVALGSKKAIKALYHPLSFEKGCKDDQQSKEMNRILNGSNRKLFSSLRLLLDGGPAEARKHKRL